MQDLDHQQYHYYSASSSRDYCCHEQKKGPGVPGVEAQENPPRMERVRWIFSRVLGLQVCGFEFRPHFRGLGSPEPT